MPQIIDNDLWIDNRAADSLGMLSFAKNIWTMDGDEVHMFRVLPFKTRMTIIRLQTGGLWLHSPVQPTAERQRAVEQLGQVEHLIAPNKIHSLGIQPWSSLYPSATVWASPGFSRRHPDIQVDITLKTDIRAPWSKDIDLCVIQGHAFLDEVIFLHKDSGTLIVTDLIQKHERSGESWFWRLVKRLVGVLGEQGGTSLDIKLTVHDKRAMKQSIETVLDWDFDNLILAHVHCIQGGAKQAVRRAFEWLG